MTHPMQSSEPVMYVQTMRSGMSNSNDVEFREIFRAKLKAGLIAKYGRVPSSRQFSDDFNNACSYKFPISGETARKWIRGISVPNGLRMQILYNFLGIDGLSSIDQKSDFQPDVLEIWSLYVGFPPRTQRMVLELARELSLIAR